MLFHFTVTVCYHEQIQKTKHKMLVLVINCTLATNALYAPSLQWSIFGIKLYRHLFLPSVTNKALIILPIWPPSLYVVSTVYCLLLLITSPAHSWSITVQTLMCALRSPIKILYILAELFVVSLLLRTTWNPLWILYMWLRGIICSYHMCVELTLGSIR